MIAESDSQQVDKGDDVDAFAGPARRFIAAPPLVPEPQVARRESLPLLTFAAIIVLAGLAHLTGAPIFISLALLATGLAGLGMHLHARRSVHRTVVLLDETTARSRAEIETLADRMWEMQE